MEFSLLNGPWRSYILRFGLRGKGALKTKSLQSRLEMPRLVLLLRGQAEECLEKVIGGELHCRPRQRPQDVKPPPLEEAPHALLPKNLLKTVYGVIVHVFLPRDAVSLHAMAHGVCREGESLRSEPGYATAHQHARHRHRAIFPMRQPFRPLQFEGANPAVHDARVSVT
eukprot:1195204-Prorocentrum_minimum.AAC.3